MHRINPMNVELKILWFIDAKQYVLNKYFPSIALKLKDIRYDMGRKMLKKYFFNQSTIKNIIWSLIK